MPHKVGSGTFKRRDTPLSRWVALALTCGIDRSCLGGLERGENNVSLINIVRIADALQGSGGFYLAVPIRRPVNGT